jgi:hypothetical protein
MRKRLSGAPGQDGPTLIDFFKIKTSFERHSVPRILSRSEGRTGSYLAYWVPDRGFIPQLRPAWDLPVALEELAAATGISGDDWTDLARRFIDDLGDSRVQRGEAHA